MAPRDVADLYGALDLWAERVPGADPSCRDDVEAALVLIGSAGYSGKATGASEGWQGLARAVSAARRDARCRSDRSALPPLNRAPASP